MYCIVFPEFWFEFYCTVVLLGRWQFIVKFVPVLPVCDCLMVLLIALDFMASDDGMVSVWRIEKDEEGSIGG
jgi:hypothetical protein